MVYDNIIKNSKAVQQNFIISFYYYIFTNDNKKTNSNTNWHFQIKTKSSPLLMCNFKLLSLVRIMDKPFTMLFLRFKMLLDCINHRQQATKTTMYMHKKWSVAQRLPIRPVLPTKLEIAISYISTFNMLNYLTPTYQWRHNMYNSPMKLEGDELKQNFIS